MFVSRGRYCTLLAEDRAPVFVFQRSKLSLDAFLGLRPRGADPATISDDNIRLGVIEGGCFQGKAATRYRESTIDVHRRMAPS